MKLLPSDIQTKEVLDWKGLHLFNFHTSSCSQKTRLVLAVKGVDWESHHIDLAREENFTEWFLGINPRGLLPILVDDGDVHIESNDIIEYIDKKHPEPSLIPEGQSELAHEFLDEEDDLHMDIRNLTFRFMFPHHGDTYKKTESMELFKKHSGTVQGKEDAEKDVQLSYWQEADSNGITDEKVRESAMRLHSAMAKLDTILEAQPLIMGDKLSLVDISWFIYVSRLLLCGYPLKEQHPHLARWHAELHARSEFAKEVTPPGPLLDAINAYHEEQSKSATRLVDIVNF